MSTHSMCLFWKAFPEKARGRKWLLPNGEKVYIVLQSVLSTLLFSSHNVFICMVDELPCKILIMLYFIILKHVTIEVDG
jgi:hypothetical protein